MSRSTEAPSWTADPGGGQLSEGQTGAVGGRRRRHRRWRVILWVLLVLVVAAVAFAVYGAIEARSLTVVEHRLASEQVPPAFDGMRIAFVSDIHRGRFVSRERVREVVDRTNAVDADLIVLGGDYVYGNPRYIDECFAELERLHAPMGVFGVLGNHDYFQGAWLTRRHMAEAGIEDLDDSAVWLERDDQRIRLGGVDDILEGDPDLSPTLEGTAADDFVVLVSHNPDFVVKVPEDLPKGSVDLMLSGHTHGGQVTFFGLWAPVVPSEFGQRYRSGLTTEGPFPTIVSNGIGAIPPPVRFFAPPQIVVVRLERAGA